VFTSTEVQVPSADLGVQVLKQFVTQVHAGGGWSAEPLSSTVDILDVLMFSLAAVRASEVAVA